MKRVLFIAHLKDFSNPRFLKSTAAVHIHTKLEVLLSDTTSFARIEARIASDLPFVEAAPSFCGNGLNCARAAGWDDRLRILRDLLLDSDGENSD